MSDIILRRKKQFAQPGRSARFQWKWVYDYRAANEGRWNEYGARLGDLEAMLRRFHPGSTIIRSWEVES